ncbi:MAG: diaminopimelate epimerase [Alphaproteobacteria bacterium]|nr:diaminopimelate epimerase [Alphaproteobacteria bacterium]
MTAFLKMHGLGNDFVVFDARGERLALDAASARALADRRFGVGCDQVIVIGEGREGADAVLRIYNSDGGEVESCGNATRCVARLLMEEKDSDRVTIDTPGGKLVCTDAGRGEVTVDMGAPRFAWEQIPLAKEADTNRFTVDGLEAAAVNVGNPHCVLFDGDVAEIGPKLEVHPMFPARTNVEVVTVRDRRSIRMRVWERGVGITSACGTGACASAVAAHRRGLVDDKVEVELDGGTLTIELRAGHIQMTGPATLAFKGEVDLKDYAA